MSLFNYSKRIPWIYGIITTGSLILLFFSLRIFGGLLVEFRISNFVVPTAGIYFALKQHRRTHKEQLNYFRALAIGVSTSLIGITMFCLFLFAYTFLNDYYMSMWCERRTSSVTTGEAGYSIVCKAQFSLSCYLVINE